MSKGNVHKLVQGMILLLVGTETLQVAEDMFFTKDTCKKASHTYVDNYEIMSKDTKSTLQCAMMSAFRNCKSFFYQQNTTTCVSAITNDNSSVSNTADVFLSNLLSDLENGGENTKHYLLEETKPKPCNDTQYSWSPEMKTCIRVSNSSTRYTLACQTNGTHLVDAWSFSKSRALNRHLICNGYSSDFWIGVNDRNVEGIYTWSDGSSLTYTNWAPNHPKATVSDKDCGSISYSSTKKEFFWKTRSCDSVSLKFICEKP